MISCPRTGGWIMETQNELPGSKHQGLRGDNSEGETH